jgi:receptor protein-tyrosine kinase/non-specific protein-tyrosine kinase
MSTARFEAEQVGPPGAAHQDPTLVALFATASFAADQYRLLRHMIEERRNDGLCAIAVTSPGTGEGKTVTSINLAASLAEAPGSSVLLVDADLRQPAVLARLGLGIRLPRGVADFVASEAVSLEQVVRRYGATNLYLLPSGKARGSPYEILNSARLASLFTQAREQFDYVVVDTPPIVGFPDFRLVEKVIDASLLVVAAHRTPRRLLAEAQPLLDPAKALGIVFNDARVDASYYRVSKYYHRQEKKP